MPSHVHVTIVPVADVLYAILGLHAGNPDRFADARPSGTDKREETRMKKILCLTLVLVLMAACAQAQVYTTSAIGKNTDVPVSVSTTIEDGIIKAVSVDAHEETPGICDPAMQKIPQAIIDAQSTEVDAVTNATQTSNAIMQAVKDALSQIKK